LGRRRGGREKEAGSPSSEGIRERGKAFITGKSIIEAGDRKTRDEKDVSRKGERRREGMEVRGLYA